MSETKKKVRNPLGLWLGAGLIIFGLLAVINGVVSLTDDRIRLIAPERILTVEVADSPEERSTGLSNRESLPADEGMLFVFDDASQQHCFWMKDTLIALDMIWLNEQKEVVTVMQNVAPDSYPESFCPDQPAKYGLEINAGKSEEFGIQPGETLRF